MIADIKHKNTSQLYLIYPKSDELQLDRYSYIKDKLHLNILFFDLACGFEKQIIQRYILC